MELSKCVCVCVCVCVCHLFVSVRDQQDTYDAAHQEPRVITSFVPFTSASLVVVSVYLCVSLRVSRCVRMFACFSLFLFFVCVCECVCVCVCVCMCVCVRVCV